MSAAAVKKNKVKGSSVATGSSKVDKPPTAPADSSTVEKLPAQSTGSESPCPSPQNFLAFVPYACALYGAHFYVNINVDSQDEYIQVEEKSKKPARSQRPREAQARTARHAVTAEEQESEDTQDRRSDGSMVTFTAVYDAAEHLVELVFQRISQIPITLIQVIELCAPYHPKLYKMTVKWTPLSNKAFYRFSKIMSHLTEVCLDGSPLAGRTYHVLLEPPSRLCQLSLASCKLDDADCAQLAALLTPPCAAAATLHALLLASNKITDQGARAFAQALRTNRGLHYLNLAGNQITDSGAISILKTLMEFPLTKEESRAKTLRRFQFVRLRNDAYANFVKELSQEDSKSGTDVRGNKRLKFNRNQRTGPQTSMVDAVQHRATMMTDKLVGTFTDPFSFDKTVVRGGQLYCVGNMALCALNLSYNDLRFPSVACLWTVLQQQIGVLTATRAEPGLLRVRVDGNKLPAEACLELQSVAELLERAVTRAARANLPARGTRSPADRANKPHRLSV